MKVQLGAEPKKVVALAGLLLLGVYTYYTNVLSDPPLPPGATPSTPKALPKAAVEGLPQPQASNTPPTAPRTARRQAPGRGSVGEFRPTLKYTRPEDRPDPMKVDPTLRLDLLAKLQNVSVEGGHRTLFDFSAEPPPKNDPKIAVGPGAKKGVPGAKGTDPAATTAAAGDVKPADPVKPPPPPIPLKFYGFSSPRTGSKRAFFLEGEEIYLAGEGELIKRRYKVVRIGLNSAIVEDTEHKHQQTLPLEEPPASS